MLEYYGFYFSIYVCAHLKSSISHGSDQCHDSSKAGIAHGLVFRVFQARESQESLVLSGFPVTKRMKLEKIWQNPIKIGMVFS